MQVADVVRDAWPAMEQCGLSAHDDEFDTVPPEHVGDPLETTDVAAVGDGPEAFGRRGGHDPRAAVAPWVRDA